MVWRMCAPSQPARCASRGPCRCWPQLAKNSRQAAPASPEALLPAPIEVYVPRLKMYMASGQRMRMQLQLAGADVDSEPSRMAAMTHRPTAVAGICMRVRRWARTGQPARPHEHTGTSVSREALNCFRGSLERNGYS